MNQPAQGLGWFSLSFQGAAANGSNLLFGRGGFQAGQSGSASNPFMDYCVENALELLDVEGESFYDARTGSVYVCTAPGGSTPPPGAQVELAVTRYLLAVGVPGGDLVQGVSVRGLGFAKTRSTIFEPHGVPGGGDMSAHARGALTVSNAEGVTVAQCAFTDVGGSAVVVAGHALGVQVVDSTVVGAGAHGVLVLGFSQLIDATGSDLPRGTRVAGNAISLTGRENKFAASVAVAIAPRTVVEGNVIYDIPRTAVYYNDMSASPAQLLRNNALFNTNRETTDTGPVYTYQRLVFLGDNAAGPGVEPDLAQHEANLIMANYGSFWPLDYDDGTMNVQDSLNVLLYGGAKQYLGHSTTHANSWIVYPDLSPNFGFPYCLMSFSAELYYSGYGHVYANNSCVLADASAHAYNYSPCNETNSADPPMTRSYANRFFSPATGSGGLGAVRVACSQDTLSIAQWQAGTGNEAGSSAGPMPDPGALADELYAFLPGPESGGSGRPWGA